MHYLLAGQNLYFPSSDDQSYTLKQFLDNNSNEEYQLPIIVKITTLNTHERSIKNLLSKNTPLLLLNTYQLESMLVEYHRSYDGRYQSNRHRLLLPQMSSKTSAATTKFRAMKKLSKSLAALSTANLPDDNSDDDYDNIRTIVRTLNEKRSASVPLCRVPINYHGFFELLNENDQSVEPFHHLLDLLIIEENDDDNNQQVRTEKWPQAFFLRSTCASYTKRYIPDERKLSGSADSCYGSLSDLDLHKNLLILNDNIQILQSGQIITILNQCSAYRSQTIDRELQEEQFISHSSSTSWLRNKSRRFFPRKKRQSSQDYENHLPRKNPPKQIHDISKKSQPYLKCRTEQDDIVYISLDEPGLFSPLNSQSAHTQSNPDSESIDISGVFQLKELISNFRFPLSVRLLNNSISFDNIYSPAIINPQESSYLSSTKFRLLLPYTEHVIFACPLIMSSSFKSQILVIPIPINSDIKIQRCLNMREISKNQSFHNLIQTCCHIINRYDTEFSYIHFPLVLNLTTKYLSKRKQPLFKKRSQSESHLEYLSLDLTKDNYRKSCEIFNHDDQSDLEDKKYLALKHKQLYHRDSFEKMREKLTTNTIENNQRQQTIRRSGYYAKLKMDKPRKYSRQYEYDSDDENYRELDHIYDYIRSGDVTDDVQRIQAKEQALNAECNHANVSSSARKKSDTRICESSRTMKTHRFPHDLDDSRPLDDDDDISQTHHMESKRNTKDILPESTNTKPITKMKRISKL